MLCRTDGEKQNDAEFRHSVPIKAEILCSSSSSENVFVCWQRETSNGTHAYRALTRRTSVGEHHRAGTRIAMAACRIEVLRWTRSFGLVRDVVHERAAI